MPQYIHGEISKDILSGIAITILIFAVSIYLPIIGLFCALFIPLPVLFYRSKLGRKIGGIIPAVAITVVITIADRLSIEVLFFVELILLGFILSEYIEMNLSIEKTILYASATVLLIGLAGLIFYSTMSSTGIKTLASDYVSKNLELTLSLYESMGMSEENILLISNSLKNLQYWLVRIIPGLAFASTLFIAWMNLLMAKPILTRKNLFFPAFGPLQLWRPPELLVWGVVGSGAMLLINAKSLKMLGLNGLIILMMIYFFAGIAIVTFFFEKKRFPPMFRFFLYSLIILQQLVLLVVIGLGLFDTWLNFRKLETVDHK
ncbi:DUF2232 domain-containing protein [Thermodesulfobacteriota bacterium]